MTEEEPKYWTPREILNHMKHLREVYGCGPIPINSENYPWIYYCCDGRKRRRIARGNSSSVK